MNSACSVGVIRAKSNNRTKYVELPVEGLRTGVRFPPPPPNNKWHPFGVPFLFVEAGWMRSPLGSTSEHCSRRTPCSAWRARRAEAFADATRKTSNPPTSTQKQPPSGGFISTQLISKLTLRPPDTSRKPEPLSLKYSMATSLGHF